MEIKRIHVDGVIAFDADVGLVIRDHDGALG
jgi:hypothetical protein